MSMSMSGQKQRGYCMRCATQKTMVKPVMKRTKNGRKLAMGTCPTCYGKVSAFVSGKPSSKLKTVRAKKRKV